MKNNILLIFSLSLLFSCGKKEEEKESVRNVVVMEATLTKDVPSLYFSGFSKSQKMIDVSFRVPGQIEKLPIKVGDKLKKGRVIGKLDDHDYKLQLQEADSKLQEALAEKRRASSHYQRIKVLYESDSASRNELGTARADYESAVANVEKAMASVDLANKRLSYTKIFVDKNYCEVSSKDAEIFENVEAGQKIATLSCGNRFEVEIAVPETTIADIYVGQKMDIVFYALKDQIFMGTVTEVGITSAEGTAYPVTILLDEITPEIRSGMAAKAIIYGKEEIVPSLVVPIEAVGEDAEGHFVYLYTNESGDQGIAKRQNVEVGEVLPSGFVINKGLKEGDLIIIKGLRFLRDGRKVKRLKVDL